MVRGPGAVAYATNVTHARTVFIEPYRRFRSFFRSAIRRRNRVYTIFVTHTHPGDDSRRVYKLQIASAMWPVHTARARMCVCITYNRVHINKIITLRKLRTARRGISAGGESILWKVYLLLLFVFSLVRSARARVDLCGFRFTRSVRNQWRRTARKRRKKWNKRCDRTFTKTTSARQNAKSETEFLIDTAKFYGC